MKAIIKSIFNLVGLEISKLKRMKHNNEWIFEENYQVLIDIGASIGKFSYPFLKSNPKLTVFAFEPIPESFNTLQETLNSFKNVKYFNTAVGNQTGMIKFNLSSHHTSSSVLKMTKLHKTAFPNSSGEAGINVSIDRLDNFISSSSLIDKKVLLKVDVQGFEYEVLEGASRVLKDVDVIITEISFKELYTGQKLFEDVYYKLRDSGFSYHGNLSQIYNPKTGEVLQANAIFLKTTLASI